MPSGTFPTAQALIGCRRYFGVTKRKAGNGTRTRDPNLGKVVLYQLSYSRGENRTCMLPLEPGPSSLCCNPRRPNHRTDSGGEGNRTPDLLNAIQALSQLSYAPVLAASTHSPAHDRNQKSYPRVSHGSRYHTGDSGVSPYLRARSNTTKFLRPTIRLRTS